MGLQMVELEPLFSCPIVLCAFFFRVISYSLCPFFWWALAFPSHFCELLLCWT